MTNYSFKIQKASNGKIALNIFLKCNIKTNDKSSNPIDIIIMDCDMPVMDGYTSCKLIKEKIELE